MTAEEMEVERMEVMEDSGSTSSSEGEGSPGEAAERQSDGQQEMEGSDEEGEEKAANPEFSKFMQGFWDLASVDVPVRYCCGAWCHDGFVSLSYLEISSCPRGVCGHAAGEQQFTM